MNPKISVIMPVYNAEKYVKETIEGILNQTIEDFELLVINDYSTDKTMEIVREFKDKRIKIIENDKNRGLAYSWNKGLEKARGIYVALMDDDALMDKERFALEMDFLDCHPEIDVVGGGSAYIDEDNKEQSQIATDFMVTNPNDIRVQMMFCCPMVNGSTMFRKQVIDTYGIKYKTNCFGLEDYHFWIDLSLHAKITNLQKTFLYKKESRTGKLSKSIENRKNKLFAELQIYALEVNGFRLTDQEKHIFTEAFNGIKNDVYQDLDQLYRVLNKLIRQAYDSGFSCADEMRLNCRNYYLEMLRRNGIMCKKGLKKRGFSYPKVDSTVNVSVIIPTYNRADKLARSVKSVLSQSYDVFEILIIDDGSKDNTRKIVEKLQDKHPDKIFYYKLEQNSGPARARNFGVSKARGEYIAFHDDDDEWHPDKLEIQMKHMLNDSSIDMTFSQMIQYRDGEFVNIVCEELDWYYTQEKFYQKLFFQNFIGTPTIIVKKNAFIQLGGFCEKITSLEDWEFALRAARELHIEFITTPLMDVHISLKSVTHNIESNVYSFAYLIKNYASEAEDRGMFIYKMLLRIEAFLSGQVNNVKDKYVEQIKQMIIPDVILPETLEEKLLDRFFVSWNNPTIDRLRRNNDNLRRYKSVTAKLLDTEDTITMWLLKKEMKKVAVYGMGKLGKCLVDRIEKGMVKVVCGIDQNPVSFRGIPVVSLEQFYKKSFNVDVIIITPLYEYSEIVKKILENDEKKRRYQCISIEDILE